MINARTPLQASFGDEVEYNFCEPTYIVDLYYEMPAQKPVNETVSSAWVKIVDSLSSTGYEAENDVITEVRFSDQNQLTHMKFSDPDGNFVVYTDGKYLFNIDMPDGSPA